MRHTRFFAVHLNSNLLQASILTFFLSPLLGLASHTSLPQQLCEVVRYLIMLPDRAHNVLLVT